MQIVVPRPPGAARQPAEVFPAWWPAHELLARLAVGPVTSVAALRAVGFLPPGRAERIAEWYLGPAEADAEQVAFAYAALGDEAETLARAVTAPCRAGGLGVTVTLLDAVEEPYAHAAELGRDVRERRAMRLRAACADLPHPLLSNTAVDSLRVVHDVLGHAGLGLGFDLQSEYAAWLYCRPLFSRVAQPAAFCELVGRVTAYVLTGEKPAFHADLPPHGL
jgi:hypothetical protein